MSELPPYELVDNAAAWRACLDILRTAPRMAVDLESNSLYAYRDSVCLIQISVKDHDFIIDPLAGFALDDLGELLADCAVEKVFHASEYDLMLVKRQYGWEVQHLFDTMWAARILGYTRMGLANFLLERFGVTQSKRFQKTNWMQRPLSGAQLAYAQIDTHFLLALRDQLAAELEEKKLQREAREIFAAACNVKLPSRDFDPDSFWSIRGARDLPPVERGILKALHVLRDAEAKRRDLPPFKVLNNEVLMRIAKEAPQTDDALAAIRGLPKSAVARMGRRLIQAVQKGMRNPVAEPPRRARRHDQAVVDRFDRLQQWRKALAQARGVESDVILARDTLWDIARCHPKTLDELAGIKSLGPHRLELYGEAILDELA